MASNINPFNVDGTFPIAGQDNSSQGFRDNFTNLRNNLSYAKSEIEDLQNKAILKSALTGTSINNDMAGAVLYGPTLKSYYETLYDFGLSTDEVSLDYSFSNLQKITTDGDISLSFSNWPASGTFGKFVLWINLVDAAHTISFPIASPGVTIGLTEISGYLDGTITFDISGQYLLEFSTVDGGENIMIRDLTRNYSTLRGNDLYYNSQVNGALLVGYDSGLSTGVNQIESLDNHAISSLGSYNAVTVGNLQAASISYQLTDTGVLAGYTITAARGNVQQGNVYPVISNSYLGYINALAFTGNGGVGDGVATGEFTQVSTINFNATGSNVSYGLGGNVTVFTRADGGGLAQALGIENDQSVKFFGNVYTTPSTPSGPTATGIAGQIAVDTNYIYVCTATNTWKRVAITSAGW
jgi:hypothetical protein